MYDLDIPLVMGRVPFHRTAFELVRRSSQADIPDGALKTQIEALIDKFFKDLDKVGRNSCGVAFSKPPDRHRFLPPSRGTSTRTHAAH